MDPNISTRPIQPVQTEMSTQQPLPPKKSNSKKVFWIFAILFFIIAFVVGGFFTGAKQNKVISQSQQKAVTPTPNPTANWKTYINTKFGFQVKYPTSWTESEAVSGGDNTIVYLNANEPIGNGPEPLKYYVFIAEENILPNVNLAKGSVGDYSVYKTSDVPSQLGALSTFITEDNKKYISISLTPYDLKKPFDSQDKYIEIFNQILSTFKFTDQNQTTTPANVKTYAGKNFTFTYPNNWLTDNKQIYDPSTMLMGGNGGNSTLYKSQLWFTEYPSHQSIDQYVARYFGNQQGFKSSDVVVKNLHGKSFYNPVGEGTSGWYVGFANGDNVILFGPAEKDITQDSTLNTIINSFTFVR